MTKREVNAVFVQAYKDISLQLNDMVEKLDEVNFSEAIKYNRLSNLKKNVNEVLRDATGKLQKSIDTDKVIAFKKQYKGFLEQTENKLDIKAFSILPMETIRGYIDQPISGLTLKELMKDISDKTIMNVNSTIVRNLIKGSSISKTARELKKVMNTTASRSKTIALTETLRSTSLGAQASVERLAEIGIESELIWEHNNVGKTNREQHVSMSGTESKNGFFTLPDGTKTRGPRLSGSAKHDISCHCSVRISVKE